MFAGNKLSFFVLIALLEPMKNKYKVETIIIVVSIYIGELNINICNSSDPICLKSTELMLEKQKLQMISSVHKFQYLQWLHLQKCS